MDSMGFSASRPDWSGSEWEVLEGKYRIEK